MFCAPALIHVFLLVQDGVCPFFEWQDVYVGNLDQYQQLQNVDAVAPAQQPQQASQGVQVGDQSRQLPRRLVDPAVLPLLQGRPLPVAPPAATAQAAANDAHGSVPTGTVLRRGHGGHKPLQSFSRLRSAQIDILTWPGLVF
jgi:hypothetical protein